MALRCHRLVPEARLPLRCSPLAAGYDLCALEACIIPPGGRATLVRTGLAVAFPPGCVGFIKSRSSLAAKYDVEAGAGVIDADYRGEVLVLLRNFGREPFRVYAADRIAQLVVLNLSAGAPGQFAEEVDSVEALGVTERGEGGFGSTGKS